MATTNEILGERLLAFESVPALGRHLQILRVAVSLEPALALSKMRSVTEMILHHLAREFEVELPKRPTLETMKGPLRSGGWLPVGAALHVDTLQAYCNFGSHYREDEPTQNHVTPAMSALLGLLEWRHPRFVSHSLRPEDQVETTWTYVACRESQPVQVTESVLLSHLENAIDAEALVGRNAESLLAWIRFPQLLEAMRDRLWAADRCKEASDLFLRAAEVHQELGLLNEAVRHLCESAELSFVAGEDAPAESTLRRALQLASASQASTGIDAWNVQMGLSAVVLKAGRAQEAETFARQAVVLAQELDELTLAFSESTLAGVLQALGRLEEALPHATGSLVVIQRTLGRSDPLALRQKHNRACLLRDSGRLDEARLAFTEVLELRSEILGGDDLETLVSLDNLSVLERMSGNLETAERLSRRALRTYERLVDPDSRDRLIAMHNLAIVLSKLGSLGEAEDLLSRELELTERVFGASHPDTLTSEDTFGVFLFDQGRLEEAEAHLHRAAAGREKSLGASHPQTVASQANLAIVKAHARDPDAEEMLRALLPLARALENQAQAVAILGNLGAARWHLGEEDEADRLLEEAVSLGIRSGVSDHNLFPALFSLCMVRSKSDAQETMELRRQALLLARRLLGRDSERTRTLRREITKARRRRTEIDRVQQKRIGLANAKRRARNARKRAKNSRKRR